VDGDHRLDIQDVLRAVVRPDIEVGVVLEHHADQVADRVLQVRTLAASRSADGLFRSLLTDREHRLQQIGHNIVPVALGRASSSQRRSAACITTVCSFANGRVWLWHPA
jgi:hypothetical protein